MTAGAVMLPAILLLALVPMQHRDRIAKGAAILRFSSTVIGGCFVLFLR